MPTLQQARAWYTGDDVVHDFTHVERVFRLAERIGVAEGADLEIVGAAALLHDARGSQSGKKGRKSHQEDSAAFALHVLAQEGWPFERIASVQHCIRAHRFRGSEPPETLEAQVLFDADKLDVIGAIGVARVIAYAALAHQPFYVEPSSQFIETGKEMPGEPHSAYHEHVFKLARIKDRLYTRTARTIAQERHAYIDEYFRRLAAEQRGEC
jgi:uncharacterized protein